MSTEAVFVCHSLNLLQKNYAHSSAIRLFFLFPCGSRPIIFKFPLWWILFSTGLTCWWFERNHFETLCKNWGKIKESNVEENCVILSFKFFYVCCMSVSDLEGKSCTVMLTPPTPPPFVLFDFKWPHWSQCALYNLSIVAVNLRSVHAAYRGWVILQEELA